MTAHSAMGGVAYRAGVLATKTVTPAAAPAPFVVLGAVVLGLYLMRLFLRLSPQPTRSSRGILLRGRTAQTAQNSAL